MAPNSSALQNPILSIWGKKIIFVWNGPKGSRLIQTGSQMIKKTLWTQVFEERLFKEAQGAPLQEVVCSHTDNLKICNTHTVDHMLFLRNHRVFKVECPRQCGEWFKTLFTAQKHCRTACTKKLSCENCGQDFDMKKQLTKHKKTCPLTNCVNVIQKSPHSESSKASGSGKLTN